MRPTLDSHPFAGDWPEMDENTLRWFTDDIRANGLLQPILLYQGQILDGRHRYRACMAAGVEPRFETFEGDELSALRRAVSLNQGRRHLGDDQRALVARRLEKRLATLIKKHRKTAKAQPTLPTVRTDTAEQADQVLADGTPELVAAVDRGDIALEHAAQVSQLEPDRQRAVVAKVLEHEEPEPRRAKQEHDRLESVVRVFSPVEAMAWKAGMMSLGKSVHAELKECARLMPLVLPGVGR